MREDGFIERLHWFIRLRWIAVVSIIIAVFFAERTLKFSLPVFALYSIAFLLAIYNSAAFLGLFYLDKRKSQLLSQVAYQFARLQIFLDFLALTILIHFSGGGISKHFFS